MISRGHDASGCDQSMSGQASASSGRIAMTAPMSHGCGSSPVIRIVCSVSSSSVAACSARVAIHANNIARKDPSPFRIAQPSDRRFRMEYGCRFGRARARPRWRRRWPAAATHRRLRTVRPVQRHELFSF